MWTRAMFAPIANLAGVVIQENPDLLAEPLVGLGDAQQVQALAGWDEISYIFPASADLAAGTPVHGCPGALTTLGPVTQSVPSDRRRLGRAISRIRGSELLLRACHRETACRWRESEITRALEEWAKYVDVNFTSTSDATGDRDTRYPVRQWRARRRLSLYLEPACWPTLFIPYPPIPSLLRATCISTTRRTGRSARM